MDTTFAKLPLKQELLKNLEELNYATMTPIQEQGLPIVLEGHNIIAQAKTGSGKTAVFGLGILNFLDISITNAQSLILCPTRELAEQVAKEIRKLARVLKNVKVVTLCGGVAEIHQEKSLSYGAHILVGTPGRVLRLLSKHKLNFENVEMFVLDEADRMLDMGFYDDIMDIASHVPHHRQTLLFSATYPDGIEKLSRKIQKNPIEVKVDTEHKENIINQTFYEVEKHQDKNLALLKILGEYKPNRLIVFCKTKQITKDVAIFLNKHDIYAEGIHGDLQQNERTTVLTKFSNKSLSILVATDVAARGLDIDDLAAVINYDLPINPEMYVHRIGRTGRAGKNGLAFNLFIQKNNYKLDEIKEYTHKECKLEDISKLSSENKYDLIPPMKTMYISGGKKNNLRPGDILGALVGEAQLAPKDVGDISIFSVFSYVAIKTEKINQAINKLKSGKIKNKNFKVGLA